MRKVRRRVRISDSVYKKQDVVGLDIGTGLVKYVQLKNNKKLTKLVGYGHIEMPHDIVVEGIISEPEKLAKILTEQFANSPWGKISAKEIVASLPESKIFTRTIEIPSVKDDDIDEAVNYEIEQSIPIPATDLYTDWQVVGRSNDKYTVFLAAAPRAIVDSYVQLIKEMKMEPLALEVSQSAIARAIIPKSEKSLTTLIVDIGAQTTNIAIYQDNLQIAASAPIGAEGIKESISSALNIDAKKANMILLHGLADNDKSSEVMKTEVKKIIEEVDKVVKYHSEKNPEKKVNQILLCGGSGSLKGLAEFIENETKIKTRTGNPWSNISIYPLKPVAKNEASLYSAAIGLCLREVENE